MHPVHRLFLLIAALFLITALPPLVVADEGIDNLNYIIDDIAAGDDFNKNYELFRNLFGAPKG